MTAYGAQGVTGHTDRDGRFSTKAAIDRHVSQADHRHQPVDYRGTGERRIPSSASPSGAG
jgi:hypothetical protein